MSECHLFYLNPIFLQVLVANKLHLYLSRIHFPNNFYYIKFYFQTKENKARELFFDFLIIHKIINTLGHYYNIVYRLMYFFHLTWWQ